MAPTITRAHAQVDDELFELLPSFDSEANWIGRPAIRPPFGIIAPTSVVTRTRHAKLSALIDRTGDEIDAVLSVPHIPATDVPSADERTDTWVRLVFALIGEVARSESFDRKLATPTPTDESAHGRMARELRDLTGLSAQALGQALGVTREQYQRWVAGRPISDTRHGQLIYLHTMAVDVARRLGGGMARVWWKTPIDAGRTPEDLLISRLGDRVHRLIVDIPDPAPVVDGVMVTLPVQSDYEEDFDTDEPPDSGGWSPYDDSRE